MDDGTRPSLAAASVAVDGTADAWSAADQDTWVLSGPDSTGSWDGETVTLGTGALEGDAAISALQALLEARDATRDGSAVERDPDALARWGVAPCGPDDLIPRGHHTWDSADLDEWEDEDDAEDPDEDD